MEETKLKLPGMDSLFAREAYKTLRTNLLFCGQSIKTVAVTSGMKNEGKTTVTLGIAKSFAEMGKNVLVIDADMRKSVLAGRNTDAKNPSGLSELLTGQALMSESIYRTQYSQLYLMFAGKYPPNPEELLDSPYFEALLDEARKAYDYVFIDTPPLGAVIDAAIVGSMCDGTVLVLGSGKASACHMQNVVEQLEMSKCRILGVVRNRRLPRRGYEKYYGSYYEKSAY